MQRRSNLKTCNLLLLVGASILLYDEQVADWKI
jgi:hypothetical protein